MSELCLWQAHNLITTIHVTPCELEINKDFIPCAKFCKCQLLTSTRGFEDVQTLMWILGDLMKCWTTMFLCYDHEKFNMLNHVEKLDHNRY